MSYKSLTINERYNILKEFGKIEKENTDALIQWRNDMSLLSQKQFQKMLQYNQYDKKIFSYAVTREPDENIVKLYEKSEVEHIWRCTYWEILNTNILYEEKSYWGQDEGFNYIVRHFVKYVEKQLIESLEGIKFTKDCLDGILRQFTLKLVDLGNKAMIMELNHLKESQNLKGDTSAERFKYFISLFENMEFLKSFYEKYSVLARLYTELSILFINNIKEIWDFIKNDKEILKEEFGIVDGEFVLNKVAIGIGDTHNFGKTVTILEFANNKKLVYKPRNLKINEAYNNLIDFLNKTGKIHVLKKLKSLSFEDHGYEEFLDHCLCETEYELQNFYIRFGEILALSYILNATDLHMENLIAYGEYPVIIDLETFIQQPNSFNDDVLNEKINYEFDSVKRTLLLESRLRQNDVNEGIDISAINGKGYVMDEVLVPINKQLAISYIEKTIENKESFDGYGMAHGLMGLTLMLYKVWKVTGIKKYLFLGESLLNKIKENIHDVESMSWCRGNVGLALGLLKIQNIIAADRENDMIQEMVDEIHTKICNSNKMKNDCICHGNLSVAEYFIFRYQIFKDEKDLKIATKIVNMVKDRQTFRSLPEIPGFGIFTGEGGLAYELLRLEKCEEVPTLLC